MKILVLGGTRFFGRSFVEQAIAAGHDLTLVNRGISGAHLFPEAEQWVADRSQGLSILGNRRFDAVLDTSGYTEAEVTASAAYLVNKVDYYLFVSTISVYADFSKKGICESDPLLPADPALSREDGDYGGMKVACENAVRSIFGDRAGIVRPGLIIGPRDHTDRFTYWPVRISEGGEVLAPVDPHWGFQGIDARDLAAFVLCQLECRAKGTWNAVGQTSTLEELFHRCRRVSGSNTTFTWVSDQFLAEQGVGRWVELPLWSEPGMEGFGHVDASVAIAAGLVLRPLEITVRDTLDWHRQRTKVEWAAGLSRERERELLAKWKSSTG